MSRQDANAAFARTSFLYGGNADYIENLYARYEADPAALDGEWQTFFESLKTTAPTSRRARADRRGSGYSGRSRRAASSSPRLTATGRRWSARSATRSRGGRRR